MKKIAISAYAFSPIRGSEAAVGWEICNGLSKYFEVHVFFCSKTPKGDNFAEECFEFYRVFANSNIVLHPVKMPVYSKIWTFLHDIGFWPFYYVGYKCWQKAVFRAVKVSLAKVDYDLLYQLNMIGFREPGYLWMMDKPFLWGPVNGFHSIPISFIKSFSVKDTIFQHLKRFFNNIHPQLSFRSQCAARKAELVFCVDQKTLTGIELWGARVKLLTETGLHNLTWKNQTNSLCISQVLNIVWSGMITSGKALNLLLCAIRKLSNPNIIVTVIGDGPLKNKLINEYVDLQDQVKWLGWLSKDEAMKEVSHNHLLVHTSLKEGTPHSILEALGMGVPVMCHNTCGMAEVVNDNNGFLIPYESPEISVQYIIDIISEIISNPDLIDERRQYLKSGLEDLTWEFKVSKIASEIVRILN